MTAYPVSAKGILVIDDAVLLALNDRDEWELPGGRPEPGETLRAAVERELAEETGLVVTAGICVDTWLYEVVPGREVLIAAYACTLRRGSPTGLVTSPEHRAVAFHPVAGVTRLNLPAGYRDAIIASRRT